MEGGEERSSSRVVDATEDKKYPVGFRFKPTDNELVEFYLLPKLQGKRIVPNDAIIEADVYQCDPEILINQMYKDRGEKRWHFLSSRTRKYQRGDRPSRRTADNRGRWKPSTGKKEKEPDDEEVEELEEEEEEDMEPDEAATEIKPYGNGAVKFCVTTLAYYVGPPKKEKKTKWLMHELTVPEYEIKVNSSVPGGGSTTLDRYAMCTIYMSPLTKWHKKEDEGTSSTAGEEAASSSSKPGPAAESGEGTSSAPMTLSSKQAGKRPAVEQPPPHGRAPAKKRARQRAQPRGGPPAPVHGNGGGAMGVQFRVRPAGYYTVPGQLAQMPWPPVTSNRLQGPVQLPQQRMYHASVQGLPGSSLLRPPVPAANNSLGRGMVMRPPPGPSGFEQKMMHPQNGLMNLSAGQLLPPPSAPQPRRQLPKVDMNDPNAQRVFSQLLAELRAQESASSSAPQQQGPGAWNLPPPQQPVFGAGANHTVGANATVPHPGRGGQLHQQQQQRSSVIPTTSVSVSGGASAAAETTPACDNVSSEQPVDADGWSGMGGLDSNSDQRFADLATMTMPRSPWMGR